MVTLAIVFLLAPSASLVPREDPTSQPSHHEGCFLEARSDGAVVLRRPLVALGMIGVGGRPRAIPLPADLAGKLRPLAVPPPAGEDDLFWCFGLPRAEGPFALVDVEGAGTDAVRIRKIQILTPAWRRAFEDLDSAVRDLDAALKAPAVEGRRERAGAAHGRGRRALDAMASAGPGADLLALAARIDPSAQVSSEFAGGVAAGWGKALGDRALALGIDTGEPLIEREFESCILQAGSAGSVLVTLSTGEPSARLGPEIARLFVPLAARIEDRTTASPDPLPRDGKAPAYVLHLAARGRALPSGRGTGRGPYFEVLSARIVHAEVRTRAGSAAEEELASCLEEVVATSLVAPDEAKRRRLEDAVERGSRALGRMAEEPPIAATDEAAARVRAVDPGARMVGTARRKAVRDRGGRLREFAARLGIAPATPFPADRPETPLIEILAGSSSGPEFAAKAREAGGEGALEEDLLGSYPLGRDVHAWEVEALFAADFEKVRAAAEREMKFRSESGKPVPDGPRTIPQWGVEVAPAGPDLLASRLALRGIAVTGELPGGARIPLRVRDLILDYTGIGDLLSGRRSFILDSPFTRTLAERAEVGGTGGPLRILREGEAVTVDVPGPAEERSFDEEVFLEERDGILYLRQPLVYLGMVGVRAFAPLYRLGPEATRALGPLVTRTRGGEDGGRPDFHAFRLPDAEGPVVLLRLGATVRLAGIDWGSSQRTYEVLSTRDLRVEFLTPEWLQAFADLDAALSEAVEAGVEAPGDGKRRHLDLAISRGSAAVETMERSRATEEMRAAASAIEPGARIVRTQARRLAGEWGSWLRRVAEALGLDIPAPLAGAGKDADSLCILARASTPAEFRQELMKKAGEDALDERLLHSAALDRMLSGRDIEGLEPEGFENVREEARKALEDRKAWESRGAGESTGPGTWEMPGWGVRLRKAEAAERAKALIIRGAIVEEILAGGSKVGLEPGDILLDHGSVYDLVMGGGEFGSPKRVLESLAGTGGQLRLLRGDRAVIITIRRE